jgi:hypothetical protein
VAGLADLGCRPLVSAGERVIANIYQEFLRQYVILRDHRAYPELLEDLAPAHTAMITQLLFAEFWTLADWPPYCSDLNSLDFSI